MARELHGKWVRHASYRPSWNPRKDVSRGIPEDCGLNSCPVPCGRGEQPLKTTLLQEASRPFRACQPLKGKITPASCRRAATRRNLSQKTAVPEIRLSRSSVQRFSGASEGVRVQPSPSRLYGANFGLSGDPLTSLPPSDSVRPEMPVPISASSRGSRCWLPSATGTRA